MRSHRLVVRIGRLAAHRLTNGDYEVHARARTHYHYAGVIKRLPFRRGWLIHPEGKIARAPYRSLRSALHDFELEM